MSYKLARERVNVIGSFIARLINLLVQRADVKLSDVHIIGHGLGAHIAGIGKFVFAPYEYSNSKIIRNIC